MSQGGANPAVHEQVGLGILGVVQYIIKEINSSWGSCREGQVSGEVGS